MMIMHSRYFGLPMSLCAALAIPRAVKAKPCTVRGKETHKPAAVQAIYPVVGDGVFGGQADVESFDTDDFAQRCDPSFNNWFGISPLPLPRPGHGAVAALGRVHILAGKPKPGGTGAVPSHFTLAVTT